MVCIFSGHSTTCLSNGQTFKNPFKNRRDAQVRTVFVKLFIEKCDVSLSASVRPLWRHRASGIVLMRVYGDYYNGYGDENAKNHLGCVDIIRLLYPLSKSIEVGLFIKQYKNLKRK